MLERFRRDSSGIERILKSPEIAAAIREKADEVASEVRARTDAEVVVDTYTTDRAAASVTIRDVRGRWLEARHGVLSRAAAAAGLEVTLKDGESVHDPLGRKMRRR